MRRYFKQQVAGYKSEAIQSCLYNKLVDLFPFVLYYFIVYRGDIEGLQYLIGYSWIIVICFEVFSLFTMYDIPIKAKIDIKLNRIVSKRIIIKSIKREYSWAGNGGYSRIGSFFQKSLSVNRYRIYYTSNDEKGFIRLLLSFDNMMLLKGLVSLAQEKEQAAEVTFNVKYLKHSKMLYDISPCKGYNNAKHQQELIDTIFVLKDR